MAIDFESNTANGVRRHSKHYLSGGCIYVMYMYNLKAVRARARATRKTHKRLAIWVALGAVSAHIFIYIYICIKSVQPREPNMEWEHNANVLSHTVETPLRSLRYIDFV